MASPAISMIAWIQLLEYALDEFRYWASDVSLREAMAWLWFRCLRLTEKRVNEASGLCFYEMRRPT